MSILNKGRCSRCIASKVVIDEIIKEKEVPLAVPTADGKNYEMEVIKTSVIRKWLFCQKYMKHCAHVAGFQCKEPPMGISASEFDVIIRGGIIINAETKGSEKSGDNSTAKQTE